jgi:hypothetical protein
MKVYVWKQGHGFLCGDAKKKSNMLYISFEGGNDLLFNKYTGICNFEPDIRLMPEDRRKLLEALNFPKPEKRAR